MPIKRSMLCFLLIVAAVAGLSLTVPAAPVEARPGPAPLAEGTPVTVTLRRGLSDVRDAYIDIENQGTNFGNKNLVIDYDGTVRSLLWFDLGSIPSNAVIDAAELRLTPVYQYPTGRSLTVSAYPLLRAWEEMSVTWTSPWSLPGAESDVYDREKGAPAATGTLSAVGTLLKLDLRGLVQEWVSGARANHGVILIGGSGTVYFNLGSSESSNGQPALVVTYHVEGTPGPSPTPTVTLTPTTGPSPTPTPRAHIYSTRFWTLVNGKQVSECISVSAAKAGSPPQTATGQALLVWEGTPQWARLRMSVANNRSVGSSNPNLSKPYPIILNGVLIGTLQDTVMDNWPYTRGVVDGHSTCSGGTAVYLDIDLERFPDVLRQGTNTLTISNEGDPTDNWSVQAAFLEVAGDVRQSRIFQVNYSPDQSDPAQTAWVQLPADYEDDGTPRPLVMGCRWWGATGRDVLYSNAVEANRRGWILVAPEFGIPDLGSYPHTPSLDVQRWALRLIDYMLDPALNKQGFRVDGSRVYIRGSSLGGGLAATIAAKYPDRFAAASIDKAPTAFDRWYFDTLNSGISTNQKYWQTLYNEIGGSPGTRPFAYESRSAFYLARNLSTVPLTITYPLSDTTVLPHHSTDLYNEILRFGGDPSRLQIGSYPGGHDASARIEDSYDFLSRWTLPEEPPADLSIMTDEGKSYYWLAIEKSSAIRFTEVKAHFEPATHYLELTTVVSDTYAVGVKVDLARLGLDAHAAYQVGDLNLETGAYTVTTVNPAGGPLALSAPPGRHRYSVMLGDLPQPASLILRQGLNGYTGTDDTYINKEATPVPHYSENRLRLQAQGMSAGLLRFDTSPIPPGKVIKGARLTLWAAYWLTDRIDLPVSVYRMRRDWSPAEATWTEAAAGQPWGAPGAGCTGGDCTPDRDAEALGVITLKDFSPIKPTPYSLNLTGVVQDWVDHPETNFGLLLFNPVASRSTYFDLGSSRSNESLRPQLEIYYDDPTPTPIPTATSTPTVTPTPTALPTVEVYGLVWHDQNRDGTRDAGEPPLAGALITLRLLGGEGAPGAVYTQTTAADGLYRFTGLQAGHYGLVESDPPGYASSTSPDAERILNPGESWRYDFGDYALPTPPPGQRWAVQLPQVQK